MLPDPLVVVVTDESGNPVEGVSVAWDAQGAGSVSAGRRDRRHGRASVQRTLGISRGSKDHGHRQRPVGFAGHVHVHRDR